MASWASQTAATPPLALCRLLLSPSATSQPHLPTPINESRNELILEVVEAEFVGLFRGWWAVALGAGAVLVTEPSPL